MERGDTTQFPLSMRSMGRRLGGGAVGLKGRWARHARAPAKTAQLLHLAQLLDHRIGIPTKPGGLWRAKCVGQVPLAKQQSQRCPYPLCQRVRVISSLKRDD